jgi:hypothetical protein
MVDKEKRLVLAVVREFVSKTGREEISLLARDKINWQRFKKLIVYHELTPFIYLVSKNHNLFLPEKLKEFLKANYYASLLRNQRVWRQFLKIADALQETGIILLPIKGVSFFADIYTDYPVRLMCDIDLLVKQRDLSKASEVFRNLGYKENWQGLKREYWDGQKCQVPFYPLENDNSLPVELHFNLDYRRYQRVILPQLWDRIREINPDSRKIRVLSCEDALFSLALHQRTFGKSLCFKYIIDIALLIKKYSQALDWDYVLKTARQERIQSSLLFLLSGLQFLGSGYVPSGITKNLSVFPCQGKVVWHFIERNTFGSSLCSDSKATYLKSHFLLYDSIWEAIGFILRISREHFALFYGLKPYAKRTSFLYRVRLFYIPFRGILDLFNKQMSY